MLYTAEPKRGCGFRKLGGLYLVSDPGTQLACHVMPYKLLPCECCGQTIQFSRGHTWIKPGFFTADCQATECPAMGRCVFTMPRHVSCPACDGTGNVFTTELDAVGASLGLDDFEPTACKPCQGTGNRVGKVGLLWVGREFYPSASGFIDEATTLGVSKRLATVPRGLVLGETWVMLARKHDQPCPSCPPDEPCEVCEGKGTVSSVFYAFKPTRLEMIVTEGMLWDRCPACTAPTHMDKPYGEAATRKKGCEDCDDTGYLPSKLAERCERQNITPVVVDPADLSEEEPGSEDD